MNVNKICILGGGSSGFITSSILAKYREQSGLDFDIKVIYSKSIGNVGVGESSIQNIIELFQYLELEDSDWMKLCHATYKTSIRFENFYKKGRYFHYPFGPGDKESSVENWCILNEKYPDIFTPERSSIFFSPHTVLSEKNKLTDRQVDGFSAYHFDTHLLGEFLKEYSEEYGVEIIDDVFVEATKNSDGSVSSLVCENGTHTADLFIDCSGFKSLLLGEVMGEDYISFENTLINNKAIVAKIPYTDKEDQLKNYTNCVALDNGWCWEIPLWNHLSVGYVHSNKFATPDEIEKELFDRYGEVEYKTVNYRTGRHERGWVKNVVGVGLSYGFIEPLESTGIATTLFNILRALEFFSKRKMKVTQIDRDLFNDAVGRNVDGYRKFIDMHYSLSSRDESEYWRYVTEEIDYQYDDRFLSQMNYHRDVQMHTSASGDECYSGDLYVLCGMNYSLHNNAMNADCDAQAANYFDAWVKDMEKKTENEKSSFEYLSSKIYK